MKKVLSIVLSIAMVVCLAPTMAFAATTSAQADAAYSDTKGTACEGAVNVLSALGVVDGFTDGTYKPEQVVTRAKMAKLIVTALGVADYASAKTSKFTDMSAATWAIPYVEYASNLNIVNGVGNNKFNPNGNVTYEQAATMIVRALGYTDKCNEMNGTWPAIYIQKATALGLFNDVTNKGATGATRGDLAIMLYNALTVDEVYADNDGTTQNKKGANGDYVTMMDTLNVNGSSTHKIVTDTDADTAVNSIAGYVGAAAEVIYNKDGDVLALSDIKTTFLSGEIKSNGKFEADNGTTYTIASDALKQYVVKNGKTDGTVEKADAVKLIKNNVIPADNNTGTLAYNSASNANNDYTIAATVSGKTITGIYSIATWKVSKNAKVDTSDLNQITKNQKLLGVKFDLNDDQEIDNGSFVLNGVDSLSDIKADDIVYVYAGNENTNNEITRVDVGTKTVTGKINKTTSDKVTIDGTAYKIADAKKSSLTPGEGDLEAGNEVTLRLDYDGKIYNVDLIDGTAGNFAVIVAKSGTCPAKANVSGTAKIELLTADGDKVFEIDGKKYIDNKSIGVANGSLTNENWTKIASGTIVKYSVNNSGLLTKLTEVVDDNDYTLTPSGDDTLKSGQISKAGIFDTHSIADSALIFAVPTKEENKNTKFNWEADTDKFSVVKKASVLDTSVKAAKYVVDDDTNKIICMIIDDNSTSDDQYGIATSVYNMDGSIGADFYIDSEKLTDKEVASGVDKRNIQNKENLALYKIKKTTSGDYEFELISTKDSDGTGLVKDYTKAANANKKVNVKNGYVEFVDTDANGDEISSTSEKINLYDKAIVYVYDKSDKEYSIGSTSDLTDDSVVSIKLYQTSNDSKDDFGGLVNYITIVME